MTTPKLPTGERTEVRCISPTGKTYLITFNPLKQVRCLYLITNNGASLKKIASAKTPTELYPKAI